LLVRFETAGLVAGFGGDDDDDDEVGGILSVGFADVSEAWRDTVESDGVGATAAVVVIVVAAAGVAI
jgi:hypothetical protein